MKYLKLLKKNIFYQAGLFFSFLVTYQLFLNPSVEYILYIVSIVTTGLFVEQVATKILGQRRSLLGAYITSLIVILICFSSFWDALFLSHLLIVVLGIVWKIILKKYKVQFFNPMVLGAVIVLLLSMTGLLEMPLFAWQWASSSYKWINFSLFFNLIFGGYVMYKTRKTRFTLTFFSVFLAAQFFLQGLSLNTVSFALWNATLYFFLLCMVLEPKTSLILPKYQIHFGIFLAFMLTLFLYFQIHSPFILSIFVFNLALGGMMLHKRYMK